MTADDIRLAHKLIDQSRKAMWLAATANWPPGQVADWAFQNGHLNREQLDIINAYLDGGASEATT